MLNVFSVTAICKTKCKYAESSQPNHLQVVQVTEVDFCFPGHGEKTRRAQIAFAADDLAEYH